MSDQDLGGRPGRSTGRCKFSGLITETGQQSWTTGDLRPVAEELLDDFGPERLMFGSDWPVCRIAGGWAAWASATEELLAPLSPAELEDVLTDTARRTYGWEHAPH